MLNSPSTIATFGRCQLFLEDNRIAVFWHLHVTATETETREDLSQLFRLSEAALPGSDAATGLDQMLVPGGSLVGGDVQQVIDKLTMLREMTGATRYVGQIDIGGQSFSDVAKGIELFATKVAPALRKASVLARGASPNKRQRYRATTPALPIRNAMDDADSDGELC